MSASHLSLEPGAPDPTKATLRGRAKKPNLAQYAPETVLDIEQLGDVLGCSADTIEREGIPCAPLGRLRRYVWGTVIRHLAAHAE